MKRTREDSRIEIWGMRYINIVEARDPEDRDLVIIQIEHAMTTDDYIVEVVKKEGE